MAALSSCGQSRSASRASLFAAGLVLAGSLLPYIAGAQIIAGDWTPNGIAAATGPGEAMSAIPVPDESGGLYVVWVSRPVGTTATEVRVRRVYSSGAWDPHWPTDGVILGPNSGEIGAWRDPSGGLVVSVGRRVWRLTSLGTLANGWPTEGRLLEPSTDGQFSVGVDGAGSVWALGAVSKSQCVYLPGHPTTCHGWVEMNAVRLDSSGNYEPGWAPPGKLVLVSGDRASRQFRSHLKGVSGGVAFVYWEKTDYYPEAEFIYVGYVLDDGTVQLGPVEQPNYGTHLFLSALAWDVDAAGAILVTDGQVISTSAINKFTPQRLWPGLGWRYPGSIRFGLTHRIFTDDAGGAFVQSHIELYNLGVLEVHQVVHHVLSNGTADPRWPLAGIELSAGAYANITSYTSTRDARGGYFSTWPQYNGSDADILARRLLPDGSTPSGWSPTGTPVCNVVGSNQFKPVPVADESGNVFVVWLDTRNGPTQVFAQKIGMDSPVPVAIASASAELEGGAVRLRWRVLEPAPLVVERSTDGVAWSVVNKPESEPSTGLHELLDEHPVRGEVNRYRLREADLGWTGGEVSVLVPALVAAARLAVVPNPVNRASRVAFTSTTPGEVSFSIHDLQGREIATSAKSPGTAGEHTLEWDALGHLPRGLYWLRMRTTGGESRSVRFVVAH